MTSFDWRELSTLPSRSGSDFEARKCTCVVSSWDDKVLILEFGSHAQCVTDEGYPVFMYREAGILSLGR